MILEDTARKTTGREPPTASARARKVATSLPKKSKKRDVEEIPLVEGSSESSSGDNNSSHERGDNNSSDNSGSDKGNVGSEEGNSQGEESSEASGEESSEASGEESSETSGEESSQEVREGGKAREGSEAREGGDSGESKKRHPFDKRMYPNFSSHVAFMLVEDEPKEHNALKCKMPTVDAWCLEDEDEEVINLVKSTPLYNLLSSYKTYDPVIISAFVERWHPETNTFHLPIGEMTITLDDVYQLTHFRITGKALFPKSQPKEKTMSEYVARVLGVSDYKARQEIAINRANSLCLGWLLRKFSKNERSKSENVVVFKGTNEDLAMAFLLCLIRCTIFCDSSVDKVSVRYLRFLKDLPTVGEWA